MRDKNVSRISFKKNIGTKDSMPDLDTDGGIFVYCNAVVISYKSVVSKGMCMINFARWRRRSRWSWANLNHYTGMS